MNPSFTNAFSELFNALLNSDQPFLSSDSKKEIEKYLRRKLDPNELDSDVFALFWYDDDIPLDLDNIVMKDVKKAIANMILAG